MSKVRTIQEFAGIATSDLTWRVREISDLRLAIRGASGTSQKAILRAGVPILYAHWEGHVAVVANAYLSYVTLRGFRYDQLKLTFRLNEFFSVFRRFSQSRPSYVEQIDLIRSIMDSGSKNMRNTSPDIIDTQSNLNSAVLKNLCCFLSFDWAIFGSSVDFIDKILLSRRNSIAHGEYLAVDEQIFLDMSNRVIDIMRAFSNEADNNLQLGKYVA